jgi:hypothetical protein
VHSPKTKTSLTALMAVAHFAAGRTSYLARSDVSGLNWANPTCASNAETRQSWN